MGRADKLRGTRGKCDVDNRGQAALVLLGRSLGRYRRKRHYFATDQRLDGHQNLRQYRRGTAGHSKHSYEACPMDVGSNPTGDNLDVGRDINTLNFDLASVPAIAREGARMKA